MPEIILLHGALGSADQLKPLQQPLQEAGISSSVLEFSAHGNTQSEGDFGLSQFAIELECKIKTYAKKPIVFGYSMGGYVALYLAINKPELFEGIITLATKMEWNPEIAQRETTRLNPGKIKEKIPAFAETLRQRHKAVDWEILCSLTAGMMQELGDNPPLTVTTIAKINCPVLFAVGDRDEMIGLGETIAAYKAVPNAQLAVLPATRHPIEKLRNEHFLWLINQMENS